MRCDFALYAGHNRAMSATMTEESTASDDAARRPDAPPVASPAAGADHASEPMVAARRRVLMLGAVGAATAFSIKPAFAQSAVSVLNCEIPVPGIGNSHMHIAADGSLVPAGTPGAFPGAARPFKGEDVKRALQGRTLPGTTYEQSQAYIRYVRRLRSGQSGFTCFASIQMPR